MKYTIPVTIECGEKTCDGCRRKQSIAQFSMYCLLFSTEGLQKLNYSHPNNYFRCPACLDR